MTAFLLLCLSFMHGAAAQDAYDAHGFTLVPGDGDLFDPLGMWRPEEQVGGSFAIQGLFEYAKLPLVQYQYVEGELSSSPLIDDLFGLNLGASYAFNRRVQVAAAMPVWAIAQDASGDIHQALGDVRLSLPLTVIAPREALDENGQPIPNATGPEGGGGNGLTASLIPFVDLPSGSQDLYLGSDGVGGGVVAALGVGGDAWQVFGDAGVELDPTVDFENLHGGPFFKGGLGASIKLMRGLALRGEGIVNATLTPNEVALTETPSEGILSLRGRGDRVSWTLGGATAITQGAGAAEFRVFTGVGLTLGKEAEQVLAPANLSVLVKDQQGGPVTEANVSVAEHSMVTDASGRTYFQDLPVGIIKDLNVEATRYDPVAVEPFDIAPGENERVVVLNTQASTLKVVALDEKDQPHDARVRFLEGPADQSIIKLGSDGEETFPLASGDWKLLAATDGYVPQEASVTLAPGEFKTLVFHFTADKPEEVCKQAVVLYTIHFDFDIDVPRPESSPILSNIALELKDCPEVVVEVGGHTDWVGTDAYNVDLSQRRMNSVRDILVGHGVPVSRLIAVGYGESRPIATNETDEGRALNRRVEFHPIQGEAIVMPATGPAGEAPASPQPPLAPGPTESPVLETATPQGTTTTPLPGPSEDASDDE